MVWCRTSSGDSLRVVWLGPILMISIEGMGIITFLDMHGRTALPVRSFIGRGRLFLNRRTNVATILIYLQIFLTAELLLQLFQLFHLLCVFLHLFAL